MNLTIAIWLFLLSLFLFWLGYLCRDARHVWKRHRKLRRAYVSFPTPDELKAELDDSPIATLALGLHASANLLNTLPPFPFVPQFWIPMWSEYRPELAKINADLDHYETSVLLSKDTRLFLDTLKRIAEVVRAHIPPPDEHALFYMPLAELIDFPAFMQSVVALLPEHALFYNVDRQLKRNEDTADPDDPLSAYDYTPFSAFFDAIQHEPVPFSIPEERWFEGVWIVAAQGRGKTNLLRHLIFRRTQQPCCIIIMDAKASGDLVRSFNNLEALKHQLVLLDPDPNYPLAINPIDVGGAEFLEYIFSSLLESKMTPNQSTLFRMTLRLCTLIPGATLDTFREIMQLGWKPYEEYVRKLPKREQDFFDHQWSAKGYAERKPEVIARLYTLMTNPVLDAIFQAKTTKVDMFELMNTANVICIENNEEKLGEQGAEFFGRLMVALVWAAARKRGSMRDEHKLPVYFFIDEAHYTIARDPKVAAIIEQCRAQKISMIFAHQRIDHIKDEDVKGALNNCAIKLVNTTGEAHDFASRLQTTPEFIKSQKRGRFACYVVDTTPTAISVSVPYVDVSVHAPMTPEERDNLIQWNRHQFCQSPDDQRRVQDNARLPAHAPAPLAPPPVRESEEAFVQRMREQYRRGGAETAVAKPAPAPRRVPDPQQVRPEKEDWG